MRRLTALLLGVALGIIGARYVFVGSWLSLVPWSIVGLFIGYRSRHREWAVMGGIYGFALFFSFMLAGYTGTVPVTRRLPFFALIGLVGLVYGLIVAFAGSWLARRGRGAERDASSSGGRRPARDDNGDSPLRGGE